ncbi:MAG: NUMOD4 domain-containing protein [Marinilabiliales bacterium]|nr:NUMOD4 domain-containing protein [Marinilabiliales bacterium]
MSKGKSKPIKKRAKMENIHQQLTGEIWKSMIIEDMPEVKSYSISNYGRIKSYKTDKSGTLINGSLLKGYKTLNIKNGDKRSTKYIHKLVAENFISKENQLQTCCYSSQF